MKKYPKSWAKIQIEHILAPLDNGKILQQGWSPRCERFPSEDNDKWGVVKTTAIQKGGFLPIHNKQLPNHLEPKPNIEIKEGDILMTCAGPRSRCGVVCLVRETRPKLMMSGKMYRFRPIEKFVNSRYLEAFLLTQEAWFEIDKMKTGINDSGLNLTHDRFKQLLVPIASTNEQHRIVAKIEELFAELDKGIESLETALHQLKVYRQALLDDVLGGNDAEGRMTVPFSELIGRIQQGWSPKCDLNISPEDGEWAVIKTTALQPMKYLSHECKPLPGHFEPRPEIEIKAGDFLMTRKGPRKRTGVVCLVRETRNKSMLCDTVYRFRCDENKVLPDYLEFVLNSPSVVVELDRRKSGISDSGISLNQGKIKSLPIKQFGDIDEQHTVVESLRVKLDYVSRTEQEIEANLLRSEALRQSILKKAFSGQLVPQDPNDEPASELLKRIATEKAEIETQCKASKAVAKKANLTKKK